MGEYPSYDSVKPLLRDLRKQDFIIEEVTDGWMVSSPHNKETTIIHREGKKLAGAKLADLKAMGFEPPGLRYSCPTCGKRFAAPVQVAMHRSKEHGLRFKCPECDQEFETPQAMGRHKKTVHVATLPELQEQLEQAVAPPEPEETPTEGRESDPKPSKPERRVDGRTRAGKVVTRHVDENVQAMIDAEQALIAAADKMVNAHKELYKRYVDVKRRMDRIEDRLGKVIQDL